MIRARIIKNMNMVVRMGVIKTISMTLQNFIKNIFMNT